ncbi:MAG: PilZ domain-containing protein [Solirubrobacteraceae bacterium]
MSGQELRRSPRVEIALACTLRRTKGSPIAAQTVNLGSGGMLVSSVRPLAIDEQIDFDIADPASPLAGHARVLRQQRHDVYALRFERLAEEVADRLRALMSAAAPRLAGSADSGSTLL